MYIVTSRYVEVTLPRSRHVRKHQRNDINSVNVDQKNVGETHPPALIIHWQSHRIFVTQRQYCRIIKLSWEYSRRFCFKYCFLSVMLNQKLWVQPLVVTQASGKGLFCLEVLSAEYSNLWREENRHSTFLRILSFYFGIGSISRY